MSPLIAQLFPRDEFRVFVWHENGWQTNNPKYNWKTTVRVIDARTLEPICEGVSQCSKSDQPIRKVGFQKAVQRAYRALKLVKEVNAHV